MKQFNVFIIFIEVFFLLSCSFFDKDDTKIVKRSIASKAALNRLHNKLVGETTTRVAVYIQDREVQYLPKLVQKLDFDEKASEESNKKVLEVLREYIKKNSLVFGVESQNRKSLGFKLTGVRSSETQTFVNFQQTIERKVLGKAYIIPIETASMIAVFRDGSLESLNSSFVNHRQFRLLTVGLDLVLSF